MRDASHGAFGFSLSQAYDTVELKRRRFFGLKSVSEFLISSREEIKNSDPLTDG